MEIVWLGSGGWAGTIHIGDRDLDDDMKLANSTPKKMSSNRTVIARKHTLKAKIAKDGLRTSLLVTPMPTTLTSQMLGFNECFEPYTRCVIIFPK